MPGDTPTISWLNNNRTSPSIQTQNTNTSLTKSITNTLNSLPVNCTLVLTIAMAQDAVDNPNVEVTDTVGTLSWRMMVRSRGTHSGNTDIWTAFFPAGGSITVTTNNPGNGTTLSTVLYCVINAETLAQGASGSATLQANESVNITTTIDNSIIFCVSADWSAINGARTYRDSAVEVLYDFQTGTYTGIHYKKLTTTAGSYTEGLTAPTSSPAAAGTSILEIRGVY